MPGFVKAVVVVVVVAVAATANSSLSWRQRFAPWPSLPCRRLRNHRRTIHGITGLGSSGKSGTTYLLVGQPMGSLAGCVAVESL